MNASTEDESKKVEKINPQDAVDDFLKLKDVNLDSADKPDFVKPQRISLTEEDRLEREFTGVMELRKKWGYWVLGMIVAIVIFDMILVITYGLGWLTFNDTNVVIAVIVDSLAKVIGLGMLITDNVFKRYAKG